MKIAVMGAGALGCYFGGRLAAAGADIAFVARGAHLAALQSDGLRIESPLGDCHVANVTATDDPATIGQVDVVLFLVKLYDTDTAARQMAPLLGPHTTVVSFQNGVETRRQIGAVVGEQRVVAGAAFIPADIRAPGIVRHSGPFARLVFGEHDGEASSRCLTLAAAFDKAGVEATVVADIEAKLWEKFLVLSALSAITTLTRLPIGDVLADPECRALFRGAIDESHAVGRAVCPQLAAGAADAAFELASGFPHGMRASMLDDLERGKRLELNDLSGAVVRLGAAHGIATPIHRVVHQALQPYVNGRPQPA